MSSCTRKFIRSNQTTSNLENHPATQMVRDLREQMASQRFEDLKQKVIQVERAAPSCHQPQQSLRSRRHIRRVV
ncbi:hypothetical protein KIN20_004935 [Parelaphostrongylus tenuis]|uniref:Uncharacterized protein n=1 Tax=Parelaphostrongylus tenuis TaxID=148309 RepID=A0AAD5QFK0_PARTN|nr:hypothetical protein KIN20_004935 [Parelaphostrongylus tenuis]